MSKDNRTVSCMKAIENRWLSHWTSNQNQSRQNHEAEAKRGETWNHRWMRLKNTEPRPNAGKHKTIAKRGKNYAAVAKRGKTWKPSPNANHRQTQTIAKRGKTCNRSQTRGNKLRVTKGGKKLPLMPGAERKNCNLNNDYIWFYSWFVEKTNKQTNKQKNNNNSQGVCCNHLE